MNQLIRAGRRWTGAARIAMQALLLAGALLGAGGTGRAETFSIPGSGNPEHVLGLVAQAFNARQAQHRAIVPPSTGTAGAIRDVQAGIASLGRVGRRLTDAERALGLVYVPLGRDVVAFAAGATIPLDNLTKQQVLDIYTGRILNWRELGGPSAPIRAIGREPGDASRAAISRMIGAFSSIAYHPGVKVVHLDPQALALLDRYPNSLGYLNRSALAGATSRLRILSLDGVAPTGENLAAGRYPAWIEFGLVHGDAARLPASARAFLAFVATPEATAILRAAGVVPFAGAR